MGWQTYKVIRIWAVQRAHMSRNGGRHNLHCYTATPSNTWQRENIRNEMNQGGTQDSGYKPSAKNGLIAPALYANI